MKKLFFTFSLILVQLVSNQQVLAETLTLDQTEVEVLIKKLYAANNFYEFEAGTFGAKYNKNGRKIVEGKYDHKRHCQLMAEFLVKEAIIEEKPGNQVCKTFDRYPLLDDEERSPYVNSIAPSPPIPHISQPVIVGEKAKVHVTFPKSGTDVFYNLRKVSEGWRIYKVESRESAEYEDHIEPGDTVRIFPPALE